MVIEMVFLESKPMRVTNFEVSLQSAGSTQLGDCIPNTIRVDLLLPPTNKNPAQKLFNFAHSQHADAKAKGNGVIKVFPGQDGKKDGQAIQTVEFNRAWISDIDSSISEHDEKFSIRLTLITTEVTISGEKFEHDGRAELFKDK
jgi:hypothetical protein